MKRILRMLTQISERIVKLRARFKRKRRNPLRVRRMIRQAVRERRFFLYLVGVSPFLPLAIFAPWTAYPLFVFSDEAPFFYWFTLIGKFVLFCLLSGIAITQIQICRVRFRRLLEEYDAKRKSDNELSDTKASDGPLADEPFAEPVASTSDPVLR